MISRSGTTTAAQDLTIPLNTRGSAWSGTDYEAITTVVMPAGAQSVTFTVTPVDDLLQEPDETIVLSINAFGNPWIAINPMAESATATIVDNDTIFTVEATRPISSENGLTGVFTFSRDAVRWYGETVSYSIGGTAISGSDFTGLSGSVTIPAGALSATINVVPISDQLDEEDESVTVSLIADPYDYTLGTPAAATVAILDFLPTLSITASDATAVEGGTDSAQFTVSRSTAASTQLMVYYMVGGTATGGEDYAAVAGSVVIPAGATSAVIDIASMDDELQEGDETVILTLAPDPGYYVGQAVSATATIADDDGDSGSGSGSGSASGGGSGSGDGSGTGSGSGGGTGDGSGSGSGGGSGAGEGSGSGSGSGGGSGAGSGDGSGSGDGGSADFYVDENSPYPPEGYTVIGTVDISDKKAGVAVFNFLHEVLNGANEWVPRRSPYQPIWVNNYGNVVLTDWGDLDFERDHHAYRITYTYQDVNGGSVINSIRVDVNNVNEEPVVYDRTFTLTDGAAAGTVVGTPLSGDEDYSDAEFGVPSHRWSIVGNSPDFAIDEATGEISVTSEDMAPAGIHKITVQVTDGGGLTDTAVVTIDVRNTVVLMFDFTRATVQDAHNPFNLSPEDRDALNQERDVWIASFGEPAVPVEENTYDDLLHYTQIAEIRLQAVRNRVSGLQPAEASPNSYTQAAYLDEVKDAVFEYDYYLHTYQEAYLALAVFLEEQIVLSTEDEALVDRVNALPTWVDGMEARLRPEQWSGVRGVLLQTDAVLREKLDSYDWTIGAMQGSLTALGAAGAFIGLMAIPGAQPYVLGFGAGLLIAGLENAIAVRAEDGQSLGEIALGAGADVTGLTGISVGWTGYDPVTEEYVPMSPNDRGQMFGTGFTSFMLTFAAAGTTNGGPAPPPTSVTIPNPLSWAQAASLANRPATAAAGMRLVTMPLPHVNVHAATVTLGSTQIILHMTGGGDGRGWYDADDFNDTGLTPEDRLTELPHRKTAHDVGIQEGRAFLKEQNGLKETDFVNPFEYHGSHGKGFDDVMVDADGNFWVVEYKGGQGALRDNQMQPDWIEAKIGEIRAYKNDFTGWGKKLSDAKNAGKLRGIAVKTPYESGVVGDTYVIQTWVY